MINCEAHCLQISVISFWLISAIPSPNHSHLHLSNFPALLGASFSLNIWFFFFFLPLPTIRLLWTNCASECEKRAVCGFKLRRCRGNSSRTEPGLQAQGEAWTACITQRERKAPEAVWLSLKGLGTTAIKDVNKQALKIYLPSFELDLQSASRPKLRYQTYLAHLCWWVWKE